MPWSFSTLQGFLALCLSTIYHYYLGFWTVLICIRWPFLFSFVGWLCYFLLSAKIARNNQLLQSKISASFYPSDYLCCFPFPSRGRLKCVTNKLATFLLCSSTLLKIPISKHTFGIYYIRISEIKAEQIKYQ